MNRGAPLPRRTPLQRGAGPVRKTPLTSSTPLARSASPIRRVARSVEAGRAGRTPAGPADTGPSRKTRQLVLARDGHRCVRCRGSLTRWFGYSLQHRRARGRGGDTRPHTNCACNLVAMCGTGTLGCHGWVEAHPLLAGLPEHGWSMSKTITDPSTVPVLWFGRLVLLGHDDLPPINL
jgi:hypothetical protein